MRILLLLILGMVHGHGFTQFTKFEHGISLVGNPQGHSPGLSWHDFDRDGWDDFTIGQGGDGILVYRNVQGVFQIAHVFDNTAQIKSVQWVDYDNDGDSDFFACGANMSCRLWRNDGQTPGGLWSFAEVTAQLNLPESGIDSMGSSWGDFDNDGFLDVYVCNYFEVNWLLHNNGDGTFTDVAGAYGVGNGALPTYMSMWLDYDNDCLLDLFVVNDLGQPTEMYRNTGSGLEAVGAGIGLAIAMDGMGIAWGDYDNDGDQDVYLTNILTGNKLMRNNSGLFVDVAAQSGVLVNALSWGCMWMDFNHDRRDDLHVATQANLVQQNINFLLQQNADQTFTNVSIPADIGNCFTTAKGDFNNDGYWDYAAGFVLPFRCFMFQNNGGTNNWLKIALTGTESNRDAIGTKIRYWVNGQQQVIQTFCGESFFSQDSQYEILSLGTATQVDSLQLEWPSGRIEWYYNLPSDQLHAFTEGDGQGLSIVPSQEVICPLGGTVELTAFGIGDYLWFDGSVSSSVTVNAPGDYFMTATNSCGYSDSAGISLIASIVPDITETVTAPSCPGDANGCIEILANGNIPANMIWTGPAQPVGGCGLPAGIYGYSFTDALQCAYEGEVEIIDPPALVASAVSEAICAGSVAEASISAEGGTPPYNAEVLGQPGLGDLPPGNYIALVTDDNGCEAQAAFVIGQLPVVTLFGSADSVCVGETAVLSYFGTGGALPYSYDWAGQNPAALPAGDYTFIITDGNACTDELTITVGEFPALDAAIIAFTNASGGENGSMEVAVLQGEGPFTIEWSTGDTTAVLDSIGEGTYSVTVSDANGCAVEDSQSIINNSIGEVQSAIRLFPNPAGDFVTLTSRYNMHLEIYDAQGKLITSSNLVAGNHTLDTAPWPSGLYYVHATGSGQRVCEALVKQ